MTVVPTARTALERSAVTFDCNDCNDCNEALNAARAANKAARRLAVVAQNALLNGDVKRAQIALRDLDRELASRGARDTAAAMNRP